MSTLRILFIGDIVGRPGRRAVKDNLNRLDGEDDFDLVIANGENCAGGFGLTREVVEELFSAGVNVLTTGNHVWDKKEGIDIIDSSDRVLRPLNYPPGNPGRGATLVPGRSGTMYLVANLSGRVFMGNYDCPFRSVDELLGDYRDPSIIKIVDVHAEATSEKEALGFHLDGRVSCVVGTHTHVQTADERVLPGGTGYITDAGMCGPLNSVIGMKKEIVLERFLTLMPSRFEVATGPVSFCAVMFDVEPSSGRCTGVSRVHHISG